MRDIAVTQSEQQQEPNTEVIEFVTELVGKINEQKVDLTGSGIIDEAGGINEGIFEIVTLPDGVDGRALGAFLFTGYPNSCRIPLRNISNPFVGGNYRYERRYTFKTGEVTVLAVACKLDKINKRLVSRFELSGTMPSLKAVKGVSPIYELWSPDNKRLKGEFGVAWLDEQSGAAVQSAVALSDYEPVNVLRLGKTPKHRYLRLDSSFLNDGRLHVRQTSELMTT